MDRLTAMEDYLILGDMNDALDCLDYAWTKMPSEARAKLPDQPSKVIKKKVPDSAPSVITLQKGYGMHWASKERIEGVRSSVIFQQVKQACIDYEKQIYDALNDTGYYIRSPTYWNTRKDFPKVVRD